MSRYWQTWLLYGASVCVVIPAMIGLTVTTVRLDRARETDRQETEVARRYAEMQERISSALWRMDWLLIPLVSQEAARPSYMYQPFYDDSASAGKNPQADWIGGPLRPSPLLVQPLEWIKLHFQLNSNNQVRSPQDPQGSDRQLAEVGCQIAPAVLEQNNALVLACQQSFSYDELKRVCSSEVLPQVDAQEVPIWQRGQVPSQWASNDIPAATKLLDNLPDTEAAAEPPPPPDPNERLLRKQQQRGDARNYLELQQREKSTQLFAYNQQMQNAVLPGPVNPLERISAMRSVWIDGKLLLVRQVLVDQQTSIQGCWLDWDKIRTALVAEIGDLVPEFELRPIPSGAERGNALPRLATLPIELTVDTPKFLASLSLETISTSPRGPISGLRLSLLVAWIGLVIGLLAIALLLGGVLRLSERRSDFVSAVTHELRTPLTTFRMYAEMLAEGMVPDPEQQRQYAQTMKVEADRLGHLVENVLQFARLENQPARRAATEISLAVLLDRCRLRLEERAGQSGMELIIEQPSGLDPIFIRTVPDSIEQILFNLVENACKYARPATPPRIDLQATAGPEWVAVRVRDYGPGIQPEQRRRLFRPFTKSDQDAANSAPGVGLGLALCQRMARDLGGSLSIDPQHTGAGVTFLLRVPRVAQR